MDKENKFAIPDGEGLKELGMYVLLHFDNVKEEDLKDLNKIVDTGIEDPRTHRISSYTPSIYHEYIRENEEEQKTNNFHLFGGKYIVLHDPALDDLENEANENNENSGDDFTSLTNPELKALLEDHELTDDEVKEVKTANKSRLIELLNKYKQA